VIFDIERAGSTTARTVQVPSGTLLRVALRQVGQAAEGCAVLDAGVSVPLDTPLRISGHLTVIPTFSGG
jgi:sulfur carrier protein ThiS